MDVHPTAIQAEGETSHVVIMLSFSTKVFIYLSVMLQRCSLNNSSAYLQKTCYIQFVRFEINYVFYCALVGVCLMV